MRQPLVIPKLCCGVQWPEYQLLFGQFPIGALLEYPAMFAVGIRVQAKVQASEASRRARLDFEGMDPPVTNPE